MSGLTIGAVARRTGVSAETIRFYEREGLIQSPPRRASGYRQYGEDDVRRLAFIQHAKSLGFTLRETGELLSLRMSPNTTKREIREQARAKLADIEERLRKLRRMQRTLKKLIDSCSGEGPTSHCPILEALDGGLP
jgi:MerR family mercuric resistance operon transcriptional regulator